MASLAFLDPLRTAPGWQKAVLALMVLVALGAGGYFVAIAPVENRVAALRSQRDGQQQEIVRLRGLAAELTRNRREAAEVEQRLAVIQEKLPTQREIPALYRTLSDAAVQAGLAVALFQPLIPRVRDFYNEIPISLVAEGGYHELGDFISRVAKLPRATTVGEMKLTVPVRPTPAPGARTAQPPPRRSVRAEMILMTYVYRPVGSPPAPKPPAAGTKATP